MARAQSSSADADTDARREHLGRLCESDGSRTGRHPERLHEEPKLGAGARSVAAAVTSTAATAPTTTSRTGAVGASEASIIAPAAIAATTAAFAAATATVAAATARRPGFHGAGFVDNHASTAQRLPIHAADRSLRLGIASHFDEAKSL